MTNITKPIGKRNRLCSKEEAKAMLERVEVVEKVETVQEQQQQRTSLKDYKIISGKNYSEAMDLLGMNYVFDNRQPHYHINDEDQVVRPLTFKENMEKLVNEFESEIRFKTYEEQLKFMQPEYLYSCTGIVIAGGNQNIRIIPQCSELIMIKEDYNTEICIECYFSNVQGEGVTIDTSKLICGRGLTKYEALEHDGWKALFEFDRSLYRAYVDIVYSIAQEKFQYKDVRAMAFNTLKVMKDQIRTVTQLNNTFDIVTGAHLQNPTNFLLLE